MIVPASEVDRSEVRRYLAQSAQIYALSKQLDKCWDTPKRWPIIRKYYSLISPDILDGKRRSPYGLGIENRMTPIEVALWNEIRMYGLPFYMQYPVGRRFVDFGDPVYQIAIEADGAQYHNQEKDAQKDRELNDQGWRVYRIKGRDTFKEHALERIYGFYGRDCDASCYSRTEDGEGEEH